MIRRILVPLDGSDEAERVLSHVANLARAFDAEVRLLQVLICPPTLPGREEPVDPLAWRLARARAGSYLNTVAGGLKKAGIRTTTEVQEGVPAEVIVDTIRRGRHHLVVLATQVEERGDPVPLGGTALKVLMAAQISVLLVSGGGGKLGSSEEGYSEILAPVDCSAQGDWAVSLAATLARASGARLRMVHVLLPPELLSRLPRMSESEPLAAGVLEVNRAEAGRYLEGMRRRLERPGLAVDSMILDGSAGVAATLERVARERGSDLMVLSAHGGSAGPDWVFGGTALRLSLSARQPTLILQDRRAAEESA